MSWCLDPSETLHESVAFRRGFRACRPRRAVRKGQAEAPGAGTSRPFSTGGACGRFGADRRQLARIIERVPSPAYQRVEALLADERPVLLDGGIATELERSLAGELRARDHGLWGTWALYHQPYAVLDVHRAYVDAGCDVVSTDTWSILGASELEAGGLVGRPGATHWMDVARLGIRLARQAVEEAGRTGGCAVAFSVNGDVDSEERMATLRLLLRASRGGSPRPAADGDDVADP